MRPFAILIGIGKMQKPVYRIRTVPDTLCQEEWLDVGFHALVIL